MADRILERERGGSMGIIGVIIGALLVVSLAVFFLNGKTFSDAGNAFTSARSAAPGAPVAPAPR